MCGGGREGEAPFVKVQWFVLPFGSTLVDSFIPSLGLLELFSVLHSSQAGPIPRPRTTLLVVNLLRTTSPSTPPLSHPATLK